MTAALVLLGAGSAQAGLSLQSVGNFAKPIYVTSDPGDAGRLFVVEREGTIQLVDGSSRKEFVDLSAAIGCAGSCEGERGLMSIALSPQFEQDGRLFVFYADDADGDLHIDRLIAAPDRESADPGDLEPWLEIPHPGFSNHNGGQLQFGPDGFLYASTGDGGGTNDPGDNAQNPNSPLGKILRLSPSTPPALPATSTIWSSGLRNPFRFSFDAATGDMVIGDVGQGVREEIDFARSPGSGQVGGEGANYGWDCREGLLAGGGPSPFCPALSTNPFVDPVFEYPHTNDPDTGQFRCSITGGYVVRNNELGSLRGNYVYSDYCSGALRALRLPASGASRASGDCYLGLEVEKPVSFGEDAARRLYVVERDGAVSRIAGQPPAQCPPPPPQPQPPKANPPLELTLVGIQAQRRRVERGKAAVLTVWVSPCRERRGDTVALLRNGYRNGSKFLSRACTARFLRRVNRNTTFRAVTYANEDFYAGDSRALKIKIKPRQRARR